MFFLANSFLVYLENKQAFKTEMSQLKKMFEENHQSFFDLLIFYLRIEAYSSLQTGDSVLNDWLRIKLRESLKRLDLRQRYMVKDSNMAIRPSVSWSNVLRLIKLIKNTKTEAKNRQNKQDLYPPTN